MQTPIPLSERRFRALLDDPTSTWFVRQTEAFARDRKQVNTLDRLPDHHTCGQDPLSVLVTAALIRKQFLKNTFLKEITQCANKVKFNAGFADVLKACVWEGVVLTSSTATIY